MRSHFAAAPVVAATTLLAACMSGSMWPSGVGPDAPTVVGVSPANAAIGVSPTSPVTITFSRSMMSGAEVFVVLHEGSLSGPAVVGAATWSVDRTLLTFTPSAPLKSGASYQLHLSPAMMGANGQPIDLGACDRLGGRSVSGGMMGTESGDGMMGAWWGRGMMGSGWRATDGTFGMSFSFTTA